MQTLSIESSFEKLYHRSAQLVTRAPGRIEFIGNHTDYNGGAVLGVALNLGIALAIAGRGDGLFRLKSDGIADVYEAQIGQISPVSGGSSWVNYPLGVLTIMMQSGLMVENGFDLLVQSTVPSGAGLSSSAALELASLEAFSLLYGNSYERSERVLLAQRAENEYVGVPCGMLDQAVSCFGKKDHLVKIDCDKVTFDQVPLGTGLHFWIFNSNQKHSLVDSLYSERHKECRAALQLLRERGVEAKVLAHVDPSQLHLLASETTLAKRARHVVEEHCRVLKCIENLSTGNLDRVGELMFQSHASSRDLFENSIPELDTFVELLDKERINGVIGARLTGGGFGGAAMALTTEAFGEADAARVVAAYRERHPRSAAPTVLHVETGDGSGVVKGA